MHSPTDMCIGFCIDMPNMCVPCRSGVLVNKTTAGDTRTDGSSKMKTMLPTKISVKTHSGEMAVHSVNAFGCCFSIAISWWTRCLEDGRYDNSVLFFGVVPVFIATETDGTSHSKGGLSLYALWLAAGNGDGWPYNIHGDGTCNVC